MISRKTSRPLKKKNEKKQKKMKENQVTGANALAISMIWV